MKDIQCIKQKNYNVTFLTNGKKVAGETEVEIIGIKFYTTLSKLQEDIMHH